MEKLKLANTKTWSSCPWCGEKPEVTKHFKDDLWSLVHRCPVFITLQTNGWSSLDYIKERWNTRVDK